MMRRIKILAVSVALLTPSLTFAAPIATPWVAPGGGIAGKSIILGEGSALNGKTMLDLMNQVDANQSAASSAQATANAAIPLTQKGAASGVAALDENKNVTSPLLNNVRTGGSDSGTDISAATVANTKTPLNSYLNYSPSNRFTVYLGGVYKFTSLATDVQSSLATGNITLYEHGTALNPAYITPAQRAAVQSVWGVTGTELVTGGGTGMGEIGCCGVPAAADLATFGGAMPVISNMNLPASDQTASMSMDDEAQLETEITAIVAATGTPKNIAPFMRPDESQPTVLWSTGATYAPHRKLALFTGALALDIPPTRAMAFSSAVLDLYVDTIKWAISNNIRMTVLVSPYNLTGGSCAYDSHFLENTQAFIQYLLRHGAVPTEYAVEDYCNTGNNNSSTGDSAPESNNQVALYLSTLPVSPAATGIPGVAGGLSEAQALASISGFSKARSQYVVAPTPFANVQSSSIGLSDLKTAITNNLNKLGGLAYQDPGDVIISGGTLVGTSEPLKLTIGNQDQLLLTNNTPIIFQGGSGANPTLSGDSTDANIQIYNPYSSAVSGLVFGKSTDSASPIITRITGGAAANGTNLGFVAGNEFIITLHNSTGSIYTDLGQASDGTLSIQNASSSADYGTGITFAPPGLIQAARPSIKVSANGVKGLFGFGEMDITGSAIVFGSGTSSPVNLNVTSSGNLLISGVLEPLGGVGLPEMTKANIIAITSPAEGMLVNDSTDHVPVIYENGSWYPLTLGTALSN